MNRNHLLQRDLLFFAVIVVLAVLAFGAPALATPAWKYCYNQSQNRIYFQTAQEIQEQNGKCEARLFFQPQKERDDDRPPRLITDIVDEKGFAIGEPGAPMRVTLGDDREVVMTLWNNLAKSNILYVLEPDFKNKTVRQHCKKQHYGNRVPFKVKDNKFLVGIREPLPPSYTNYGTKFVNCFDL